MEQKQVRPLGLPRWVWITIIIAILIALSFLGWIGTNKLTNNTVTGSITNSKTISVPVSSNNSATNSGMYTNKELGFSFEIPKDLVVFVFESFEGGYFANVDLGKKLNDQVFSYNDLSVRASSDGVYVSTLADLKDKYAKDNFITKTTLIKIGGQNGYKFELGGIAEGFGAITTNGKVNIEIIEYPSSDSETMDEIISSFRFAK